MNKSDQSRNRFMLKGKLADNGYDWWWHNFTGYHRKTGKEKSFFIEYFICNPGLGESQAVLGQDQDCQRKGRKPSYAMILAGCWGSEAVQLHNYYPVTEFSVKKGNLDIRIGKNILTEELLQGYCRVEKSDVAEHPEYMTDAGEMSWNLRVHKKLAYHVGYGASLPFRVLIAFEMFWHAEGIKTEFQGEVIYNGEVYDVIPEKSYGYADKNWGSDFTSPWLWISSCHMKSMMSEQELKNSAVEFGGGRPVVFGVPLQRKILGGLIYEGDEYDFNFSKFWQKSKVEFRFQEGRLQNTWKVRATNKKAMLELILKCPVDEMLFMNYESPDGKKRHNRLWNGGTGYGTIMLYHRKGRKRRLIDMIRFEHAGCEYGEYDV